MPTYVFRCENCKRVRDVKRSIARRDDVHPCSSCMTPMKRDLGAQFRQVRVAEVPGTGNGKYGSRVDARIKENRVKRREFEKHQRKLDASA